MTNHIVSDEQLDSLASEYMTRDLIKVIVDEIKNQKAPTATVPKDLATRFAQVKILKDLYQWIQFTDAPETNYPSNGWCKQYEEINNRIEVIQKRLIPELNVQMFDYMNRDPRMAIIAEEEYFDVILRDILKKKRQ